MIMSKRKRAMDLLDDAWDIRVKFDGKVYSLHETFTDRPSANRRAEKKREEGLLARVKRVRNFFDKSYIPQKWLYRVYIRPKPKRKSR